VRDVVAPKWIRGVKIRSLRVRGLRTRPLLGSKDMRREGVGAESEAKTSERDATGGQVRKGENEHRVG